MGDGPASDAENDDALLELLRQCSEKTDALEEGEQEKLDKALREECGDAAGQQAEEEDKLDARLMLFHEAERLMRTKLRDGLGELLRADRDLEKAVGSPPPSPPPSAAITTHNHPPPSSHPSHPSGLVGSSTRSVCKSGSVGSST